MTKMWEPEKTSCRYAATTDSHSGSLKEAFRARKISLTTKIVCWFTIASPSTAILIFLRRTRVYFRAVRRWHFDAISRKPQRGFRDDFGFELLSWSPEPSGEKVPGSLSRQSGGARHLIGRQNWRLADQLWKAASECMQQGHSL
jgi:hypothetical protein